MSPYFPILYPAFRAWVGLTLSYMYKDARRAWLRRNPPGENGLYTCALCDMEIPPADFSIDHIIPQTDDIELKLDITNFQPTHGRCNSIRGTVLVSPVGLAKFRSLPEGTFERDLVEKILEREADWKSLMETKLARSSSKGV